MIGIVSIIINASFCEDSNMIACFYEFTVKQLGTLAINVKKTPDPICSDLANSHFLYKLPLDNET